jgi:hypothetical protein
MKTKFVQLFKRTLEVRTKGTDARELADMYFFETLVRLHCAGEGEPYTGLKPAGTPIEPIVLAADKALETGSSKELTELLTSASSMQWKQRKTSRKVWVPDASSLKLT